MYCTRKVTDEVDFFGECMDEARRYYTNIVGKYVPQVQAVLKKPAMIDISQVCPLHGFVCAAISINMWKSISSGPNHRGRSQG